MITEGLTRREAAEKHGLTDHGLYSALCKPHVLKFKTDVLREFREGLAERALVRVDVLSGDAKSENVRLEASKTLLSLDDRFTPATKIKHEHSGSVSFTPGYVIDLSDQPPTGQAITDRVVDAEFSEVSE